MTSFHNYFYNGPKKSTKNIKSARADKSVPCCYAGGDQASNTFALYLNAPPTAEILNKTIESLVKAINTNPTVAGSFDESKSGFTSYYQASDAGQGGGAAPAWGSGPHIDMGIFGTAYVFDILSANNLTSLGVDILLEPSYPSFGYFISQNATTLWESWEGTVHEIGSTGTSRNHIMFGGSVARFIKDNIAGLKIETVKPIKPFKNQSTSIFPRIKIMPSHRAMRRGIRSASVENTFEYGKAALSWKFSPKPNTIPTYAGLSLNVTIPPGQTASVRLPLIDNPSRNLKNVSALPTVWLSGGLCKLTCSAGNEMAVVSFPDSNDCGVVVLSDFTTTDSMKDNVDGSTCALITERLLLSHVLAINLVLTAGEHSLQIV